MIASRGQGAAKSPRFGRGPADRRGLPSIRGHAELGKCHQGERSVGIVMLRHKTCKTDKLPLYEFGFGSTLWRPSPGSAERTRGTFRNSGPRGIPFPDARARAGKSSRRCKIVRCGRPCYTPRGTTKAEEAARSKNVFRFGRRGDTRHPLQTRVSGNRFGIPDRQGSRPMPRTARRNHPFHGNRVHGGKRCPLCSPCCSS